MEPMVVRASDSAEQREVRPSLFRMDSDFRRRAGVDPLSMFGAAAIDTFGGGRSAARFLAWRSGGTAGQSEGGQPTVTLPDGETYRTSDPGLDSTDVAKAGGNIVAMAVPATWAARVGQARNLGIGRRAALQGTAAATADTGLQAVFNAGEIDPTRTALAGAGGAGGELAGTVIGRIGGKAMEFARSMGSNREAARALAREAGIENVSPDQLARLSNAMEEIRAGADPRAILGREEFGFIYTQGQRLTEGARKFQQLSREEVLRQTPVSNGPMLQAEQSNRRALSDALAGMGERFGGRPGSTPAELAQGAASRLGQQADELSGRISAAYETAGQGGRSAVSAEAVAGLPNRLRNAVREFAPNFDTTPATARTLEQVRLATQNILKSAEGGNVTGVTLRALETQRRILNNNINAATNRADRAAMVAVKREFDGWLDEAVDTALVTGDPSALAAMKEARALRAEFARRFEGGADSDRFIAGLLDGSRTPEELVNIALGAGQVSKSGAARFIERLRVAANGDPEVIGRLRAAHFERMTRGNNGEPLNMGQIIRNIRSSEYSNASVVKALYSPDEWGQVRRLAASLEPLVARGEFGRTSGTAERLMRTFLGQGLNGVPLLGPAMESVRGALNAVRAARAVSDPVRAHGGAHPGVPAGFTAGAGAASRED
ncbi:hypothetical protein [Coralloluteibacterium thermophilus]|uniref:DdrB-like domain-containing protein n=1 Tax=Coralloluteibacterium thermophilum TaxID=2707049 RepID=A0ABV9NKF5_9GAMM